MAETGATSNPPLTTFYPGIACLVGGILGSAAAITFGMVSPSGFSPFGLVLFIDIPLAILGIVLVAIKKPLQMPALKAQPDGSADGGDATGNDKPSAFKTKMPAKNIGTAIFIVVAIAFVVLGYLAVTQRAIYLYGAIFCVFFWLACVLKYSSQALETPILEGITQATVNWQRGTAGGCIGLIFMWPIYIILYFIQAWVAIGKCLVAAPACYTLFIQDKVQGKLIAIGAPLAATFLLALFIGR